MDDKLGWMINLDGRYDFDMGIREGKCEGDTMTMPLFKQYRYS